MDAIHRMIKELELPAALHEVKVPREMFPDIAKGGMEYRLMPLNPVPLSEKEILDILEKAY